MVVLMIVIAIVINPWGMPLAWNPGTTITFILQVLAHPFIAIALATIPVVIICWIIKVLPDLDYSIWVAFGYMLYLLIVHFL